MSKYYITTAIAYTSGKVHIGNTYEIVLADAIARFQRLKGNDVFFQTGTDEHGQKIEDKAKNMNMHPQQFVDKIAGEIKNNFDLMNTSYDYFMRTTNDFHKTQVKKIFKKLFDQNDIYKGSYEGMYCKACESFFTKSQLIDDRCPDCQGEVEFTKEEAYFLNLQKYADRLIEHLEKNPNYIQPVSRKNEMINNFIKPGLQDLCISRTSFSWGIPVDFDPKHVVYVWIDALTNYITSLGYDVDGNHGEKFLKYWPADVHVIGKDILRFHSIYWSILLMALDIPLPKAIFAHPWLLEAKGEKMSKSKNNVIYAEDICEVVSVDALRYYLLNEMPYANDGKISWELLIERINSDLANVLGNLVNRTITMSNKYFNGKITKPNQIMDIDRELISMRENCYKKVENYMENYHISDAINEIFVVLRRCNKYIDETTPWTLAKNGETTRLEAILYQLLETIRICGVLLQPYLVESSTKILQQLNCEISNFESIKKETESFQVVEKPTILFARLNKDEILEKLEQYSD